MCGDRSALPQFTRNGFGLQRCIACGCVFVGDDPAAIDFSALYDESYYRGGHDAVFADYLGEEVARRAQARRRLWQLRHLPPRAPQQGRLLDIGCAAGFFLAEARRHYDAQGVELSAWAAAQARERFGLRVCTGTLEQAALPADHFDLVTLWDVIEHVAAPVPLLAEAARVLRPGGLLVLTTGDWGSAHARALGADWHLVAPPWHLTMFDRATMTQAAQRAGLRRVHCASEGVGGPAAFWRRRAGLLLARLLDRGDIMRMSFTR